MDLVSDLVGRHFAIRDGELVVGGLPVSAIAREHGTPLFVYDACVLDRQWKLLRATLPARFDICYSVKANPSRAILAQLLAKGCGLEIASGGELVQALRAGCPPGRILFAGPGKTEAELELALARGIGEVHVESLLEATRIATIAHRLGQVAHVAVRVNPDVAVQGGAMRMGGMPTPFGIDEEALEGILKWFLDEPALELRGIHLFTGTQILDHAVLARQYRRALEIGARVGRFLGRPLATVDFGGGLGIPYFAGERALDMTALRLELAGLLDEVAGDPLFAETRFVVEPGRFLVGEAGIYVARVTDVKISRGRKFVILDGGMNHHLAASGNLGQVVKRNFPLAVLNRLEAPRDENVDVVGPLCTPLDTLARDIRFPGAEVGDLVGIFQSGAYARTASPLGFLSHPPPPEVLVEGGRARLIQARGTWGASPDEAE